MLRALSLASSPTSVCHAPRGCFRTYTRLPLRKQPTIKPTAAPVHIPISAPERKRWKASKEPGPAHKSVPRRRPRPHELPGDTPSIIRDAPPYTAPPSRPLPLPAIAYYPRDDPLGTQENAAAEPREQLGSWHRRQRSPQDIYHQNLITLANTQDPVQGWAAYSDLLTLVVPASVAESPKIPFAHLHRLCRLLSRSRPKNRVLFLRMLSLMYYIQRCGGNLHLFEWNALIDIAGKGTRKPRPQDFKLAVDIYADLAEGFPPGHTFSPGEYPRLPNSACTVRPDIVTYTTLINHAIKTLHGPALQHATRLLTSSGISPNRITHLCLLSFYTATKSVVGVRKVLANLQAENMQLGLDGVNSCLWAYAHNNRLDIVRAIYRVLRHSIFPEEDETAIVEMINDLEYTEGITVPLGMRPNEITFTSMIQCMSYHGHFAAMVEAFKDTISTDNTEVGALLVHDEHGVLRPARYGATVAIYRAVFLGFSRHAVVPPDDPRSLAAALVRDSQWTLDNLEQFFASFLDMSGDVVAHKSLLYWIMVAYNRASAEDIDVMRRVWGELCTRFNGPWGAEGNRLQRLHQALNRSDSEARRFLAHMTKFNSNDGGWVHESGWR